MTFQILKGGGSVYYGKDIDFTWNGTQTHYSDGVRLLYYRNPSNTTYLMYSVVNGVWSLSYEEAYDPYCVNIGVPDDFFENIVWCNFDLYSAGSSTLYSSSETVLLKNAIPRKEGDLSYPFITNSNSVLSTGNFDYLCINSSGFVGNDWQDFYVLTFDYSTENAGSLNIYPRKKILISGGNSNRYYTNDYYGSYIFMIPSADLGLDFKNGNNYAIKLAVLENYEFEGSIDQGYKYIYEQKFTVGDLSAEDESQNSQDRINSQLEEQNKKLEEQNQKLDKQTSAIKENTETNKNIFQRIGDIFTSILELPGKIVNLIVDGLKSLFIPEDGFFEEYFNDLNNWFSDRLGFLYYPLDLLFDLLDRILNINFTEPTIYIPEIREPVTNQVFIKEQNFNFNTLLEKESFKTMHNIYLILVDAIIYIGLVILLNAKYKGVIMK